MTRKNLNAQTLPLHYYFKRSKRLEIPKKSKNTAEILVDKDWKINKFSALISHQNVYNFNTILIQVITSKKISLNQTVCTHIHSRHTYNIYLYQHDGRENLIGSLQTSF